MQKLALTSPTRGGRSVDIVCLQSFFSVLPMLQLTRFHPISLHVTPPNYRYIFNQYYLIFLPNCNSEICTCKLQLIFNNPQHLEALVIPSVNILMALEGQINL
jgi:hypothetical protein